MNQQLVIEQSTIGDMIVLQPKGDIDMSRASAVKKSIAEVIKLRPAKLVIDLAAVEYLDSSGIATLIEALQITTRNKMKFALVAVGPKVRSAFEITKLMTMFNICATVDEAAKI